MNALVLLMTCLSCCSVHGARIQNSMMQESLRAVGKDSEFQDQEETSVNINRDLSQLDKSYYASYNAQESNAWNAREAFRNFIDRSRRDAPNPRTGSSGHYEINEGVDDNAEA